MEYMKWYIYKDGYSCHKQEKLKIKIYKMWTYKEQTYFTN